MTLGSTSVSGSAGGSALGGAFYGRETFQPEKIMRQITAIHAFFYATFATLLFAADHAIGLASLREPLRTGPLIARQMLSGAALSAQAPGSAVTALSFAVAFVLCGSLAFVMVVGRAKRALDFAATMFATHLVCCTFYAGIPAQVRWWALNLACIVAMTVVCDVLSRRKELRDIAAPRQGPEEWRDGEDDVVLYTP